MKSTISNSILILVFLFLTFANNLFAQEDSLRIIVDVNSIFHNLKSTAKGKIDNQKLKNELNKNQSDTFDLHLSVNGGSSGTTLLQNVNYPNEIWQKMEWEKFYAYIIMEANFSRQEGDFLYFDLMQKIGNIEFKATATKQDFLETYIYAYDLDNYVENSIKEGTLKYSLVEKKITYMSMNFASAYFGNLVYQDNELYIQIKFPPEHNLWFTGTNSYFPIPEPVFDLGNQFPTADFTYSPNDPKTDEIITLDASSSTDPDGGNPFYLAAQWDFGDGSTGNGKLTEHIYTTPGEYDVCLTIFDINNLGDKICKKINVFQVPQPPQAVFSFVPQNPTIDDIITFDASESSDPDGQIVSYQWDFGNGTGSTEKVVKIKYDEIALYTINLIVEDNTGLKDTTSRIIDLSGNTVTMYGKLNNMSFNNSGNLVKDNFLEDAVVEIYEKNSLLKSTKTSKKGEFYFDHLQKDQIFDLHISATGIVNGSGDAVTINKIINNISPTNDFNDYLPLELTIQKYNLIYDLEHLYIKNEFLKSYPAIPLIRSYDESNVVSLLSSWSENFSQEETKRIEAVARLIIAEQVLDSLFENAVATGHSMSKGIYSVASASLGYISFFNSFTTSLIDPISHLNKVAEDFLYKTTIRLVSDFFITQFIYTVNPYLPTEYEGNLEKTIKNINDYILSTTNGTNILNRIVEKEFQNLLVSTTDELLLSSFYIPATQKYIDKSAVQANMVIPNGNLKIPYDAAHEVINDTDYKTNQVINKSDSLLYFGGIAQEISDRLNILPPFISPLLILSTISVSIRNIAIGYYCSSSIITGLWLKEIASRQVPLGISQVFNQDNKSGIKNLILNSSISEKFDKVQQFETKRLQLPQSNFLEQQQNYFSNLDEIIYHINNNQKEEAISKIPDLLSSDEALSETQLIAQGPVFATAHKAYKEKENFTEQYQLLNKTVTDAIGERISFYTKLLSYMYEESYSTDSLSIQANRIKSALGIVEQVISETVDMIADTEAPPFVLVKRHSIDSTYIKPGVDFELKTTIQNVGTLTADSVIVELEVDSITTILTRAKFIITELAANESYDLSWSLQLADTIQQKLGTYLIKVNVPDGKGLSANGFYSIKTEGLSTVNKNIFSKPIVHILFQNYPNPFKDFTTISYQLSRKSNVTLNILDINGKQIKSLVNTNQDAGNYSVDWDGTDQFGFKLVNGIYFYRLITDYDAQSKMMLIIK